MDRREPQERAKKDGDNKRSNRNNQLIDNSLFERPENEVKEAFEGKGVERYNNESSHLK